MSKWGDEVDRWERARASIILQAARVEPGLASAMRIQSLRRWPDLEQECRRLRGVNRARDRAETREMVRTLTRAGFAGLYQARAMAVESAKCRRRWCKNHLAEIRAQF